MIRADVVNRRSLRRSLVRIVMAFDQHREQIAFDALDTATGEVSRGRIRPADRLGFRRWLRRWDGEEIEAALEATTGWRFMVEELEAVGAVVHLAEPAETSALRGPKRRAKTDRRDARRLRELLQAGRGAPAGIHRPTASHARTHRHGESKHLNQSTRTPRSPRGPWTDKENRNGNDRHQRERLARRSRPGPDR